MNEISKTPLVDILSRQLDKRIAMKHAEYVELGTLEVVSQDDITTAVAEQDKQYLNSVQDSIDKAIQGHLDTQAQNLKYDNMNSIGKYVGYDNKYRAEAESLGAWTSLCWDKAGEIQAAVENGDREIPIIDEVLSELPVYEGV